MGLPLVKLIKRIVVGAEVLRHAALTANGAVEHSTERDPIDRTGLDAEANDTARVLIDNDKDPVGAQGADSQRNRSTLQRLSFMWPRNVSQDGPAASRPGQ